MVETSDYLTVTALTQYLKRKFDFDPYLKRIYLTGEISNFRRRPGTQYFSLKDDHAKINAIMFGNVFSKVKFEMQEGMKVLVTGRISLYEASGAYQIYIDSIQPDGVGALYQAFEQLKTKLAAEGLFDVNQRALPLFPKRVAVITSQSGAVIQDIMTTVARRYPILQLVLFPAVVQGDQAADSIVAQLSHVKRIGGFDALIIGRGGGSIEDLWPFNEERVARALVQMPMPIVSSVGHETDTTIADFIADKRAATPTAAAEYVTPVTLVDALTRISQDRVRLINAMTNRLALLGQRLTRAAQHVVLTQPDRLYDQQVQQLDRLDQRLQQAIAKTLTNARHQLSLQTQILDGRQLLRQITDLDRQVVQADHQQVRAMSQYLLKQRQAFQSAMAALDHLSPLKILQRGYAVVSDTDDHVLRGIDDYQIGEQIRLQVDQGQILARVESKEENNDRSEH